MDGNRLADTRAAEQADFAAFGIGAQKVNHFDAGFQNLDVRRLVFQSWCRPVNGVALFGVNRPTLVNRVAQKIENASECRIANGNGDRLSGVVDIHAAHEAVGGRHRNTADDIIA